MKVSNQKGASGTSVSPKREEKYVATHQSLGCDVSKLKFDVCFSLTNGNRQVKVKSTKKFSNTVAGFKALIEYIKKFLDPNLPFQVVMEVTGVYHESLAFFLTAAGYRVSLLLPNKSHSYAKSLNAKSKTDASDAQILAQIGLERNLNDWTPADRKVLNIKRLFREREDVQEAIVVLKNQREAVSNSHEPIPETIKRQNQRIKQLEKILKEIDEQIEQIVKSEPKINALVTQLTSIHGVGDQTALNIIAETGCFELIENKSQLVSYAGYDIVYKDSGTSVKGKTRISKKGNSHIRKALHFPAMVAVKKEGELRDLYLRILERNPNLKMKALVAVQRKLLVLMYSLYKNGTTYDPNYKKNNEQNEPLQQVPGADKKNR